jgi:hypothetical protein
MLCSGDVSPGISCAQSRLRHLAEKSLKGRLPARAQGRDAQSPLKFIFGGSGKIEKRVDRGDREAFRALGNFDDFIASAHLTLF